jgi:hypothetical protein
VSDAQYRRLCPLPDHCGPAPFAVAQPLAPHPRLVRTPAPIPSAPTRPNPLYRTVAHRRTGSRPDRPILRCSKGADCYRALATRISPPACLAPSQPVQPAHPPKQALPTYLPSSLAPARPELALFCSVSSYPSPSQVSPPAVPPAPSAPCPPNHHPNPTCALLFPPPNLIASVNSTATRLFWSSRRHPSPPCQSLFLYLSISMELASSLEITDIA